MIIKIKLTLVFSLITSCMIIAFLTGCSKYQNNNSVYAYTFSSTGFRSDDRETLGIAMPKNSICLYKTSDCSGAPDYCDPKSYDTKNTNAVFSINSRDFFTMRLTVRALDKLANAAGNPNNYHCTKEKLNYSVFSGKTMITPTASVVTCHNLNHSGSSFAYTPTCNTTIEFKKLNNSPITR